MSHRRALAVAVAALAALVLAPSALAQTYDLESADVRADVLPNGTLSVAEDIRVAFSGSFTYGYRDIPVRKGERVQVLGVREAGSVYRPGAPTQLEPGGPAGHVRSGAIRRPRPDRLAIQCSRTRRAPSRSATG